MSSQPALTDFAVLKDRDQIFDGRVRLQQAGLDFAQSPIYPPHVRPDVIKSWDVARMVELIQQRLQPHERVLDVGCFACEILPALDRLGFSDLHGIDLNAQISDMPAASRVRYHVGDMMATPLEDGSVSAITAVSTIEHGFDQARLLAEVSRLLRPGGVFLFSTDYWPEKIDTSDVRQWFNLDWTIFDVAAVKDFLAQAQDNDLWPFSEVSEELLEEVDDQPISWHERDYTFLYGVLVKGRP